MTRHLQPCFTSRFLLALGLIVCSNGCVVQPERPAGSSRDHAFISYWPPPTQSKRLKLAIKDNIDMKGVVTTAGSGPSYGKFLLLSYLPPALAVEGTDLCVYYMDELYPVKVAVVGSTPIFDPTDARMKS